MKKLNDDRDRYGRFIHGHKVDLPRNSKGRFIKKCKEKTMDEKRDISSVEKKVDELLEKHLSVENHG